MKIKSLSFLIIYLAAFISLHSQNLLSNQGPGFISTAKSFSEMPSLASQLASGQFVFAEEIVKEVNPKHRDGNKAVPGKGLPIGNDPLWEQQSKAITFKGKEPILTFVAASSGVTPTDPTGAVGPNHFVNSWNSAFRIWDKAGNPLTPAASLATIFPGQTLGDPIVMYDQIADRFILTEFYTNGFLVAITQGPDPVYDGWFTYQFPTNTFPDYPKFSLWSDGYYITSNKNSSNAGTTNVVYAIERDKMLIGDTDVQMIGFPLPNIKTNGFYSPLGFNVNGSQMPPPGNAPIVYMQDDAWSGVSLDHLKIWTINVDWETPVNSTISAPQILNTLAFDGLFDGGSFSNLPQPSGPDIDALQATIMYMAQYRRFNNYNSAVFNYVIDLNGNDNLAGIRWYELRQNLDGGPWEIFQEGTYAQPDGHSAFSGNMCIDSEGNIALAYTIVSNTKYPSLRYTGRFSNDPPNIMTIQEESFGEGTQSDPSFRYGDYSQMTIDPLDDKTFWSIGEYFTGGSRKNLVGVFKIAPDLAQDVGIISIDTPINGILSEAESVTVTIRNFGILDQSVIPVSYQVDGGMVVTEIYTGTIPSNNNVLYTFNTTADFSLPGTSYQIIAGTGLVNDQNPENDTVSKQVTHLFADDIGVSGIITPVSGSYLSDEEIITITLENFGAYDQSGFEVFYVLNGGSPVSETVPGPLNNQSTLVYSFNTTADLSAFGYNELIVSTSLPGDANGSNDALTVYISNSLCQPQQMCSQGVGIFDFQLGTISNYSGCNPNGYGNFTNLITDIIQGSAIDMSITTGYGNVYVKVWIDFNDNFNFEPEEVVVNDFIIAPGQTAGTYTESIPFDISGFSGLGEHLLRAKVNYNASVPSDPCASTMFGETEDYIVNIILGTGVAPYLNETNDLLIISKGNNQFLARLEGMNMTETLILTVHNIQGQMVIYNRVQNTGGIYEYEFDMSYSHPGMYLLRLGSDKFGKIERFIVQ